jgi:hypothetical protein
VLGLRPIGIPQGLLAARRILTAAGFRLALLVPVAAAPTPSPASPLTLLLAVLAPRLLGMGRWPRFGLRLIPLRVLALLLRMFLTARFLALLLGAVTSAVTLPLRRLPLPLPLAALLHRPLVPLVATTARAVRSNRTRGIRHGRFLGGLALEPAD